MSRIVGSTTCALVFLSSVFVQSQQGAAPPTGGTDNTGSPIDVPDIIIKGSATIRLMATSFSKQSPLNTPLLSKKELDSINSLDKQSPLMLHRTSASSAMPSARTYHALVRAEMGLNQTPDLGFSYGNSLADYALFCSASYLSSEGYAKNTAFNRFGARADARYCAPGNYGLFGGSVSQSSVQLSSQSYKFFAVADSSPSRASKDVDARFSIRNSTNALPYYATFEFGNVALTDENSQRLEYSENRIKASLGVSDRFGSFAPECFVKLDLRPFQSRTLSDNELGIGCSLTDSVYDVNAQLSYRGGMTSQGNSRGDICASVNLDLRASSDLSFHAKVERGLSNNFFSSLLQSNAYLQRNSILDFRMKNVGAQFDLHYHPSKTLELSTSVGYDSYKQDAFFELDSSLSYSMRYQSQNSVYFVLSGLWHENERSTISGTCRIQSASLENSIAVPYVTPLTLSLQYQRHITEKLDAEIQVAYVGSRSVSADVDRRLKAYTLLNGSIRYNLANEIGIFIRVENLLNSSIFVYERYRERGSFASLGLEWKF